MCIVDTWLAHKQCTEIQNESQNDFCHLLAEELIDNDFDGTRTRSAGAAPTNNDGDHSPLICRHTGDPRSGVDVHLTTPTKRKRKKADGTVTNQRLQGRCIVCERKTAMVCSTCNDESGDPDGAQKVPWLCRSDTGRTCFSEHCRNKHCQTA